MRRLQETTITTDVSPPQPATTLLAIEDGQPWTPPPSQPPTPEGWDEMTDLDKIIDGIVTPPGPPSPKPCPPPQRHVPVFAIPSDETTWITFEGENGDCDYNNTTGELRQRDPPPPPLTFGAPSSTGTSSWIPFNAENAAFYYHAETGEMRPETTQTPSQSPSQRRERHAWPSPAEGDPRREDAGLSEELTQEREDLMQVKEEETDSIPNEELTQEMEDLMKVKEEAADSIPSTLTETLSEEDQDELKDESIVRQNAEPFADVVDVRNKYMPLHCNVCVFASSV